MGALDRLARGLSLQLTFGEGGDRLGRMRMRSDATLRPARYPRGIILSTGEDIPRGQSLRARMLVLEVAPGSLRWDLVTEAQKNASEGLYAQAMAGFVRWLAERYEHLERVRDAELAALRDEARQSDQHRRTPATIAQLSRGFRLFLDYAQEVGAIDDA